MGYLRECIASIYEHTRGLEFEIVVVDNASPEGNVDTLKSQFSDVTILGSSENLGFSKANNLGVSHSSGDFLLFLNPDTKLLNSAINMMLDQARTLSNAGIIGCKLLNSDCSVQTTAIQKFPKILNQLLDVEYLRLKWPQCHLWEIAPLFGKQREPIPVEAISGACMLVKRNVFDDVGGFSEEYFMYAEDIDLNYKVAAKQYVNYYVGQAEIIHYGGTSSKKQRFSQWATVMKFRAMLLFYQKNYGSTYAAIYRTMICGAAVGRLIVLGLVCPFSNLLNKRESVRGASAKWNTVLKCALGLNI